MPDADKIKRMLLSLKEKYLDKEISREEYLAEKADLDAMLRELGEAPKATTPPSPAVRPGAGVSHGATISGPSGATHAPSAPGAGRSPLPPGEEKGEGVAGLAPGSTFAERYEIEAELGEGGMGVTYRAKDNLLDRTVCLKVIRPELVANEGIAKRFLNEARVGISLTHDNFVRMHDAGRSGGRLYLSMEYVEGTPMRQWLMESARKGQPIPVEHAVETARQVLLPLCEAHAKKVVHRDLKPENVILVGNPGDKGFRVEVLDFGIAKVLEGPLLTVEGARMGTTGYMSPEQQNRAETALPSADVYAVGAMLYEMLTGILPLGVVEPPSRARDDCPAWLSDAVLRAISPFPQKRFPSAKEFLEALGREDAGARPPLPPGEGRGEGVTAAPGALGSGALPAGFLVPDAGRDHVGNPVVLRGGKKADPATGLPFELWLDVPRAPSPVPRIPFILVPAGEFMMGSPDSEAERQPSEGPVHRVRFARPFYMGKCAVTQGQWEAVMGSNPSHFTAAGKDAPVEQVSWDDCQEFINKLNELCGSRLQAANAGAGGGGQGAQSQFRLPSEAEWEYACRAGTRTTFSFGATITPEQVNYNGNYPYGKASKGKYRETTVRVGSLPPNAWGLYEMHGNVWEWCEDVWHDDYTVAPEDGSAWLEGGNGAVRVLRGGSWIDIARLCRSAIRNWNDPCESVRLPRFAVGRGCEDSLTLFSFPFSKNVA